MQTVPVFAYLVPILFLFGFGPVAAIVATIIYAMPPMVRITILALRGVPAEIVELGRMVGCTRAADDLEGAGARRPRRGLMVGVNQVIMLSLNMVIIASMIGAGGLGFDVLAALRRLDIGAGLEAGARHRRAGHRARPAEPGLRRQRPQVQRHARAPGRAVRPPPSLPRRRAGIVVAAGLARPRRCRRCRPIRTPGRLSTGGFWAQTRRAGSTSTSSTRSRRSRTRSSSTCSCRSSASSAALPWLGVVGAARPRRLALGGWRLALLCVGCSRLFIAVTGQWEKAMITVYLCGISVLIACADRHPDRHLGGRAASAPGGCVQAVIDTLQTLPSFVYLMPVVMLFRVGDFTAMLAVVAYAVAPAIRYTGARHPRGRPAARRGRASPSGCTPLAAPDQDQAQAGAARDHARPQPDHHARASRCW